VKNKKLFAILTLVCFMFTLMPVAAFAAPAAPTITGGAYAHVVTADTTVEASEPVAIMATVTGSFYVYATDANGALAKLNPVAPNAVVVSDKVVMVEALATGQTGQDVVSFDKPGTYKLYLAEYKDGNANDVIANTTYARTDAEVLAFLQQFNAVTMYDNTVTVGEIESNISVVVTIGDASVKGDGGFSVAYGQVQVTNNTYGVPNAEVTLYTDSYGLQVTPLDAKTNAAGILKFMVTGTVPSGASTFNVYASYAGKTGSDSIQVTSAGATTVTATDATTMVNKGTALDASGIAVKFAGVAGEAITGTNGQLASAVLGAKGTAYKVACIAAPAGFDKTASLDLAYDATASAWDITCADDLDFEGTYTFKVTLANGSSANASVTVKKFGEPVAIQFVKAPTTVALADNDLNVVGTGVYAVDANGVTKPLTNVTDYSLSVNGKAVVNFAKSTGVLEVTNNDDYVGSTITVLAVYKWNGKTFTATNEITVVDAASTVNYVVKNAEVGKNSTLVANVVDASGKKVEIPTAQVQVIVLDKPEGAIAGATGIYDTTKDQVFVTFLANVAGEYKVQTVVTYNDGADKYISGIETITVGAGESTFKDVVVVSLGADSMIVNNKVVKLDVAPFIENNRTMMQFNVLYVFGIDVQWVAETQSIVAEGNGIKVVMQLGSKVATVNGEEVTLDVAPYSVNGRTVVPVGFITGTFGINPAFTYNADGSIADILFTK